MPLSIRRLPQARVDSLDIWLHIAADNLSAADRQTKRFDEIFELLADFPDSGPLRPNLGSDIRIYPIDNFVVIYRVTSDAIEIIRVLHAARNISSDLLSD